MTLRSRRRGEPRCALGVAIAVAGLVAAPARADDGKPAEGPPELTADIAPVLGANAPVYWGWNEFVVRLQNVSARPLRGEVEVRSNAFGHEGGFTSTAPYAVGAGAAASIRVPMHMPAYGDVTVRIVDEAGKELTTRQFTGTGARGAFLVDVNDPSHLRGAIHETTFVPGYAPGGGFGAGSASAPQILLGSPRFDPATGDPILPDRAALYGAASAVVLRSDTLARVVGAELDALAGWVLSGGTLALVFVRPEDVRHPTVAAFVGAEPVRGPPSPEMVHELSLPTGSGSKIIPFARAPSDDVNKTLVGWTGGNLHGSPYGSSASYGLGEVHLLGFDPTKKPGVDDPWVLTRMIDLVRAAHDRRSTLVFSDGPGHDASDATAIRRQLDPNESSRWAIAAAAFLLCIYSILAGPVNFGTASKAGTPLRALRWLPLFAAGAFAIVVGIGVAAKGVRGRARHLTLVEAGAGMSRGVARRWRGFYASSAEELTVRTSDGSSVVASAVQSSDDSRDKMVVDRDGARLVGLAALPWQTVVVREDGFASLGEGIALVADGADVVVHNRSGRDLRAAILAMPAGDPRYFAHIKDGESVRSGAGRELGKTPEERNWIAAVARPMPAGAIDVRRLGADYLDPILEGDARGLADAWNALEQTAGPYIDWFPQGVPVLLAQLDGGEGRTSDAGLRLDSDRLLVRVVGYGGRP